MALLVRSKYWQSATVPIENPVRNDLVINVQVSFTRSDNPNFALSHLRCTIKILSRSALVQLFLFLIE